MCAMGLFYYYFFPVAEGARFVTNTPFSACTALFHCYCTTDLSIWCYGAVCNCGWQVHAIVSTLKEIVILCIRTTLSAKTCWLTATQFSELGIPVNNILKSIGWRDTLLANVPKILKVTVCMFDPSKFLRENPRPRAV